MNKEILRLAIPNIISNISVPLLSAVDLILMGHQGEETPQMIGAIAIGAAIFNMIYWGFGFLRMGTTGLTAQAYGADNKSSIQKLLKQGLIVASFIAVFLLLFQYPIGQLGFSIMGTSEVNESTILAKSYFFIRIWAAPAVLILYVLNGWFFGMQNAKIPMWIVIAVNISNIIFNLFFALILNLGSDGVALGTVISQYIGLSIALIFLFSKYKSYLPQFTNKFKLNLEEYKRFFQVNADIFIRTVCLIITFTFFTRVSTQSGDTILAVNSILLQLLFLSSYAVDGFAYASESLVGKYTGKSDLQNLKKSVRLSIIWGLAFSCFFAMIYILFGEQVLRFFAEDEAIIENAMPYLKFLIIVVIAGAPAFIWDGIYIGATASVAMRNTMILATFLFFFPIYFLLVSNYGNDALWIAMIAYMIARGLGLSLLANKEIYASLK